MDGSADHHQLNLLEGSSRTEWTWPRCPSDKQCRYRGFPQETQGHLGRAMSHWDRGGPADMERGLIRLVEETVVVL